LTINLIFFGEIKIDPSLKYKHIIEKASYHSFIEQQYKQSSYAYTPIGRQWPGGVTRTEDQILV